MMKKDFDVDNKNIINKKCKLNIEILTECT